MVVTKQQPNECGLHVISALSGVSVDAVRQVAQARARALSAPRLSLTRVLDATAHAVGGERLAAVVGFRSHHLGAADNTGAISISNRVRTLPARGRGAMRVYFSQHKFGHVMVWEDGLIYDSEHPEHPKTLREYRQAHPRVRVHYITMEEVR